MAALDAAAMQASQQDGWPATATGTPEQTESLPLAPALARMPKE